VSGLYDEILVGLHGVWKRRWLALAVAWGIALIGWLIVSMIPARYESSAKIVVQSASLLPDTVGITPTDRAQAVEQVRQTLTSSVNLQKVVRATDLGKNAKSDDEVAAIAGGLSKKIEITAKQDNLFEIAAEASEPRLARQIVQKMIDLFVDGSLSGGRIETGQAMKFLDQQIAARSQQLAAAEAKRAVFQGKFAAVLPGMGTIDQRLDAARAEMARIDGDLAAAQSGLAAVNGQLAGTPAMTRTPGQMMPGGGGDGRAAAIRGQIAEGAARGWTDAHPDMVALRQQLARTPSGGGTAPRMSAGTSSPNPMYMSLRSMQAEKQAVANALAARKSALQAQINSVVSNQASNPQLAAEQTEVERNYTVLKAQYDKLLADREDVRLRGQAQSTVDSVKISVIDPPSAPSAPAAPNRPLLLTLVLLVAAAAGAGTAFAMGQLKRTFATAPRLAAASGLPVLGSIAEVITRDEKAGRAKQMKLFYGGSAALAGLYALLIVVEFIQRGLAA
jgi:polysaccharide chain length determinant protein (PEP-CTERM system associated)